MDVAPYVLVHHHRGLPALAGISRSSGSELDLPQSAIRVVSAGRAVQRRDGGARITRTTPARGLNTRRMKTDYDIIVIGGGHAGAEAAWAASRLGASVAMITLDPSKIGAMSCNPAIGGLAKGQMVREIDALGGLMGLATDATGIQFRMLNRSKGPAVWGPRAQCDKYKYAVEVQRLLATCPGLEVVRGEVAEILTEGSREPSGSAAGCAVNGVRLADGAHLRTRAVVVGSGTFLRALMHTGERKTEGGR